jgi:hypothetical protein
MKLSNTQLRKIDSIVRNHHKVWSCPNKDEIVQYVLIKFSKLNIDENFDFDYVSYWIKLFVNQWHYDQNKGRYKPNRNHSLVSTNGINDNNVPSNEDDLYQELYINEFLVWCNDNLTDKQIQMVELLSLGNSKVQVSEVLGCSKQNVGQQIKKIQKLYQEQLV